MAEPSTREEKYLAKIAGEDIDISNMPEPSNRIEGYLKTIAENGGGCALDVVGFDGGKGGLTIPGVFANLTETDLSRLAGWNLMVNGSATSKMKMKVSSDGSVSIVSVGMTILVR